MPSQALFPKAKPGRLAIMKPPHAEADQFDPELYCLLHDGTEGDIAFYKHLCKHQAQVLELGCGAGRVSIPLVRQGSFVVGLEQDRGMLRLAAQKRAQLRQSLREKLALIQGDMRRFALNALFDRIVIPFNSLYCLGGEEPVRECLSCCFAHLKPGGQLAFDCYPMYRGEPPFEALQGWLTTLKSGRQTYDVYENSVQDPERQQFAVTYTYKDGQNRAFAYTLHHYYLFVDRFRPLLQSAGFTRIQERLGFKGRQRDGQRVWIAEAPQKTSQSPKEDPT